MLNGIGTCTFGSAPFGYGDQTVVADPIGNAQGDTARYLNPLTRDWEIDANTGEFARMPATRQRVLLALSTIKGSALALPDIGVDLPRVMGDAFDRQVRSSVLAALYALTDVEKVIRVDSVTVDRSTIQARITVSYADLTTGQNDTVTT